MENEILLELQKNEAEILEYIASICEKHNLEYFLIGGTLLGAVRHKGFIPWDDDIDIAMPRKDYNKLLDILKTELNDELYMLDTSCINKYCYLPFTKIRTNNTIYEEQWLKNYLGSKGIWIDIFPLDDEKKESFLIVIQKFFIKIVLIILRHKNLNTVSCKGKITRFLFLLTPSSLLHFIINHIMMLNNKGNSLYFVNFGSQYDIKKQTHLKEKYYPAIELEFEEKMYKAPRDYDYVLTKIYGGNYMQLPPPEKRVAHNPVCIKFRNKEAIYFEKI
jgi:lipopolysaccharide cholinephosphotransferase